MILRLVILLFVFPINPQSDPARGQVHFCHKLIANLFEKGNSPCERQFLEERIRKQILEHYLIGIGNTTSYYGIFLIHIFPSQTNQTPL